MSLPTSSADLTVSLLDDATALSGDLTDLRHRLHRDPEIGLQLPRTQEKVLSALDGLGYEISTGITATSVTAVLRGTAARVMGATVPRFCCAATWMRCRCRSAPD